MSDESRIVAYFKQVNGWFASDAYVLNNQSDYLDTYELVAVIMGMNEIQKNAEANSAT